MSRAAYVVLGIGIVLLILIGLIVVVGTSSPIISRLWGEPSQVGPDFYHRMGFWLAVVFAAFLGGTPPRGRGIVQRFNNGVTAFIRRTANIRPSG